MEYFKIVITLISVSFISGWVVYKLTKRKPDADSIGRQAWHFELNKNTELFCPNCKSTDVREKSEGYYVCNKCGQTGINH